MELHEDGPRLPVFDLDRIAPNDARLMLKSYIELTWSKFLMLSQLLFHLPQQCAERAVQDAVDVPWDLLNTAVSRKRLLVNPESFSHMKTLDPIRMAPHDVYDFLGLLLKSQNSGIQPLEFSIKDNFDCDAELQDDEISDLPTPPPNSRTSSPENASINCATAELDISGLTDPSSSIQSAAKRTFNTAIEPHAALTRDTGVDSTRTGLDDDVGNALLEKRTPESELHAASPGDVSVHGTTKIDDGFSGLLHGSSSRSPSNSTAGTEPHTTSLRKTGVENATADLVSDHSVQLQVERNTKSAIGPDPPLSAPTVTSPVVDPPDVAIRKVASASYLSIIPDATAIEAADQTTSQGVEVKTSNSQSKKRTQMEIEQEVEKKQRKKRAKIAVPAREQSSRYDISIKFLRFC